jgi:hypothetical protein
MIGVVGIDQGGASRREALTARRCGRFSRRGVSDGAGTPSFAARAVRRR